jgi:hypothetical protein
MAKTLVRHRAMVHQPKRTAAEKYKHKTTAPKTSLDWQLALADPLTEIGRDFYNLVLNTKLKHEDLVLFQERLAFLTFVEQKRVKEQILRDIEYAEERRERLLKSWADSQLQYVPMENAPESTKGLLAEILELLLKASKLTVVFNDLALKQNKLNAKWDKLHQANAHKIINILLNKRNVDILGKDLVGLIEAKQNLLMQKLIPTHPDLKLRIIPHLAKKLDELETKDPRLINSVYINITKVDDINGELGFHANLVTGEEPLMGSELIKAIKTRKGLFHKAGVDFHAGNHIARAAMFQKGAEIYNEMQSVSNEMRIVDSQAKENIYAIQQALGLTPKLTPEQQRKLDELDEHGQVKSRNSIGKS